MSKESPSFDSRPHRRILVIALPAILANSSTPLVGLVDTWAVGHLPSAVHLAAVGLGSVVFNYLFWAFGFLRMGTTGLVAQASGRDDAGALNAEVARAMTLGVGLGLLLILLQRPLLDLALAAMVPPADVTALMSAYFHIRIWAAPGTLMTFAIAGVLFGLGRTGGVLAIHLVLNITNAILNVWFVIGLGMGVEGIALGTLIAQWLAAAMSLWILLRLLSLRAISGALRRNATWALDRFRRLVMINGFIFLRTILLMTALAIIMRIAGRLGTVEMAASHVVNQYMMLVALGLDGFAHAAEALAGNAWGEKRRQKFRRWVWLTGLWAVIASFLYSLLFWQFGDDLTRVLTDIAAVRAAVAPLMPLVIALPVVAVWCFHFDGVYIGATAALEMLLTMAVAFTLYLALLEPMTSAWGLRGLWGAVLVFMAARGLAQALWLPRLSRRLPD